MGEAVCLEYWVDRAGCSVIRNSPGSYPSAIPLHTTTPFQTLMLNDRPSPSECFVIATFGQSNHANNVLDYQSRTYPANLYQYDWRNGEVSAYQEPLKGTNSSKGNTITDLSVEVAVHSNQPVLVVPFAVGGSSILSWAYDYLSHYHEFVLARMQKDGVRNPLFLWHQGETDAANPSHAPSTFAQLPLNQLVLRKDFVLGLSQEAYGSALSKIVEKTRRYFPDCWFGIALVSVSGDKPVQDKNIHKAQYEVATSHPKNFVSADSDRIPLASPFRSDRTHFAAEGARMLCEQYSDSLRKIGIFLPSKPAS